MNIKNKNVIITGGAGGIGTPTVLSLIEKECIVGVVDNNEDALIRLLKIVPPNKRHLVIDYHRDITSLPDIEEVVKDFVNRFGHIDILINNAGINKDGAFISLSGGSLQVYSVEDWKTTMETNLYGHFYITREVVEQMVRKRTRGVIINVTSMAVAGRAGQTSYGAAKAGLDTLTRCWAQELAALHIRVAGIAPGIIDTPMPRQMNEAILNDWIEATPMKRLGTPEEVAHAIIFILENDFFCGRILELDGGLRM